jgi:VWFA-related protein
MRNVEHWQMIPRYLRCLLSASLVLLASTIGAQEPPQPAPVFVDSIDVEVVNIDVVVTDNGKPVSGLGRDDFEILVNGKPVEISNFYAVSESRPVTTTTITAEAEPPVPAIELPDSQKLNMVVLIDDSSLQRSGRKVAFEALRELLAEHLGPGQRVMLVRHDTSVKVHCELTDDPQAVLAALDELEGMVSGGMLRFNDWMRIIKEMDRPDANPADLEHLIRFYAQNLYHESKVKIAVLRGFIDTLAGLDGRKVIVFVSDGISVRPGESLFVALNGQQKGKIQANRYSLQRQIRGLIDSANASRVTFYTVSGAGWEGPTLEQRAAAYTRSHVVNSTVSMTADMNHFESMAGMAVDTGGQTLRRPTIKAFQRVTEYLDTYYSLGIVPDDPDSAEQRKVKVKVREKGMKVHYRNGFRAISQEERLAYQAIAALIDSPDENPLQMSLEVGERARRERRRYLIPVTVMLPTENLAFLQDGSQMRAKVVLHVTSQDARGGIIEPVKDTLEISIPDHAFAQVPEIIWEAELQARQGELTIALSAHDELGGVAAAVSTNLVIGDNGTVRVAAR